MNPQSEQALRGTPCSVTFRIRPPHTMQYRASGRVAKTGAFPLFFIVFAQAPGTRDAPVLGKIGRHAAFLKRNQESDIPTKRRGTEASWMETGTSEA
jgi:hypothetical protein